MEIVILVGASVAISFIALFAYLRGYRKGYRVGASAGVIETTKTLVHYTFDRPKGRDFYVKSPVVSGVCPAVDDGKHEWIKYPRPGDIPLLEDGSHLLEVCAHCGVTRFNNGLTL